MNDRSMVEAGPRFQFVGGDLALDFCNTVGGKRGGVTREKLHSFNHFVAWCEQASLLQPGQGDNLRRFAVRNAAEASVLLGRAIELREAIFRICLSASGDKMPTAKDMSVLNSELAASMGRLRIGRAEDGGGFVWQWTDEQFKPEYLLGPIARSAAELLVRDDSIAKVHQCAGDGCGWLFMDCSKNHSRRWCDMRDCGNRAKVRRHRQRENRKPTRPG